MYVCVCVCVCVCEWVNWQTIEIETTNIKKEVNKEYNLLTYNFAGEAVYVIE